MQIGRVGKRVGLSVDAIRFYERNSLLPRTPGGFRQYGESDVETLAFIRRVQGLGSEASLNSAAFMRIYSPGARCIPQRDFWGARWHLSD